MELRHLRYFVAVAEERSFRRASLRLHISQPPLSRQIRELEAQIGVQLFKRTPAGIELTAAGGVFLEEARRALRASDDAIRKARRAAGGETGHIEIAYFGSVIFDIIPQLIATFRRRHPSVTIGLSNLPKDKQISALRGGWLDVGFARFYRNERDIASELVLNEPIVLAVHSANQLATRQNVTLSMLKDEPMVLFPRSSRPNFADEVVKFCDQAGFSPHLVQQAEDLVACLALVSAQVGVALVPGSAVKVQSPGVRFVRITRPSLTSKLTCVYRRDSDNPLLSTFLEVAGEMNHSQRRSRS